ncbi:MAG: Gar1/Naf1 family protein [Candidatus Hadarchaeum sp.]|uniref:H/ACA ribonucleoprotein complex subunit GAR1 n=1 Tax=Candidatus Hadarchaeum sp. TaxID=2883567 RepID=UPI00316E6700
MVLTAKILHIRPRGLIARGDQAPKMGQIVLDSSKRRIGNVVDIFGPVRSPYFTIKPASEIKSELNRLVGTEVYVGEPHAKGGKSEKVPRVRKH